MLVRALGRPEFARKTAVIVVHNANVEKNEFGLE